VSNVVPLFVCLCLGILLGNRAALPPVVLFNLLPGPAVLGLPFVGGLGAHGETIRLTLFESGMRAMTGDAMVAVQNGPHPPLITLLVSFGIALLFLTLPGWRYLLEAV
jgi:hypothetical protein